MKKIIYLASFKANHPNYNVVYQDILGNREGGSNVHQVIEMFLNTVV